MKIAHLSDLHIRPRERATEYATGLRDAVGSVAREHPDLIIVTGDLLHNGSLVGTSGIVLLRDFVAALAELAPVKVLEGNHDYARADTGPGMLEALLRDTPADLLEGVTRCGDVVIAAMSARAVLAPMSSSGEYSASRPEWPDPGDLRELYGAAAAIAVAHVTLDDVVPRAAARGYDLAWVGGYDAALLGDVHSPRGGSCASGAGPAFWAYAGSLFQQNFGEAPTGHGFLVWTLDKTMPLGRRVIPRRVLVAPPVPRLALAWTGRHWRVTNDGGRVLEEVLAELGPDAVRAAQTRYSVADTRSDSVPPVALKQLRSAGLDPEECALVPGQGPAPGSGGGETDADATLALPSPTPEAFALYLEGKGSPAAPLLRAYVNAGVPWTPPECLGTGLGPGHATRTEPSHATRTAHVTRTAGVVFRGLYCYAAETEFWPGPGVTAVCGPNGTGKSALLDAMHIGTFGRPGDRAMDSSAITVGARTAATLVELSIDGEVFQIVRHFARDPRDPRRAKAVLAAVFRVPPGAGRASPGRALFSAGAPRVPEGPDVVCSGTTAVEAWVGARVPQLHVTSPGASNFFRMDPKAQERVLEACVDGTALEIARCSLEEDRRALRRARTAAEAHARAVDSQPAPDLDCVAAEAAAQAAALAATEGRARLDGAVLGPVDPALLSLPDPGDPPPAGPPVPPERLANARAAVEAARDAVRTLAAYSGPAPPPSPCTSDTVVDGAAARVALDRAQALDEALRTLGGCDPERVLGLACSVRAGTEGDEGDEGYGGRDGGDDDLDDEDFRLSMHSDHNEDTVIRDAERARRDPRLHPLCDWGILDPGADPGEFLDQVRDTAGALADVEAAHTRALGTLCAIEAAARAAACATAPGEAAVAAAQAAEGELRRMAIKQHFAPGCPACLERHRELARAEADLRDLQQKLSDMRAHAAAAVAARTLLRAGTAARAGAKRALESRAREVRCAKAATQYLAMGAHDILAAEAAVLAARARRDRAARRAAHLRGAALAAVRLADAHVVAAGLAARARQQLGCVESEFCELERADSEHRAADLLERVAGAHLNERVRLRFEELSRLDVRAGAAAEGLRLARLQAEACNRAKLERDQCEAFLENTAKIADGYACLEAAVRSFRYHSMGKWMRVILGAVEKDLSIVFPGASIGMTIRKVVFTADGRTTGVHNDCDELVVRKGTSPPDFSLQWLLRVPGRPVVTPLSRGSAFESAICDFLLRVRVAELVLGPRSDLVFADEAFGSFDEAHLAKVPQLLRAMAARGKRVVFVTHSIVLAAESADAVRDTRR